MASTPLCPGVTCKGTLCCSKLGKCRHHHFLDLHEKIHHGIGNLAVLPLEILQSNVCNFLDTSDIINLGMASKGMRSAIAHSFRRATSIPTCFEKTFERDLDALEKLGKDITKNSSTHVPVAAYFHYIAPWFHVKTAVGYTGIESDIYYYHLEIVLDTCTLKMYNITKTQVTDMFKKNMHELVLSKLSASKELAYFTRGNVSVFWFMDNVSSPMTLPILDTKYPPWFEANMSLGIRLT